MGLDVDISKKFKDFTLEVKFNTTCERTGLLGASGCGKSMTLKCIAGIEKPDKGRIDLNGRVLFDSKSGINLTPQERKIGYLFQNYALFPTMTVAENIGCGIKGKQKKERINEMIELLHLKGLEKRYPSQLSGGQQQRVALARILAYEPDVLMLDEPFSALDTFLKENLQQELLETLERYQGDTLIVSHNRDEIYNLCNKIVIIDQGRVTLSGITEDIFLNPKRLVAARLTGCKNISYIEKISDYSLRAVEWDMVLNTQEKISDTIKYVGIRAHDIRRSQGAKIENSLILKVKRVNESPFEKNIICKSNSGEIWWKISNAYWKGTLEERMPEFICMPKSSLMLLE